MKETNKILGIYLLFILIFVIYSCTKIELEEPTPINLGVQSTSTSIKSITQSGNIVTAEFATTVGAKYSVLLYLLVKKSLLRKKALLLQKK